MKDNSFQQLKERVIDNKLCFFCGACISVCSADCIAFKDNGPELDGECTECGRCLEACPGQGSPLKAMNRLVFGRDLKEGENNGPGIRVSDRNLVSNNDEIFRHGYTGGKLTATLAFLLEKKEIDAAIISQWGENSPYPWVSWPAVVRNRDELIKGTGSKYVFCPSLIALREVAERRDIKRAAIVGLGCHLQGLRKLQVLGKSYAPLVNKIKYTFGLYCGAPMVAKNDFLKYAGELCGISPEEIASVNFRRVSKEFDVAFDIKLRDGSEKQTIFHLTKLFGVLTNHRRWNRCRLCTDYSAELSDISFGGVHVTCRTPAGEDIVNRAIADGWLVHGESNEMFDAMSAEIDRSVSTMKKVQNMERISEYRAKGKPAPVYE